MKGSEELRRRADLLRALAHPARLLLLEKLQDGPRCVSDIRELLEVRQANTSQHLAVLRAAGLVDYRERGTQRCYYILRPRLIGGLLRLLSSDEILPRRGAVAAARRSGSGRPSSGDKPAPPKPRP